MHALRHVVMIVALSERHVHATRSCGVCKEERRELIMKQCFRLIRIYEGSNRCFSILPNTFAGTPPPPGPVDVSAKIRHGASSSTTCLRLNLSPP